MRADNTVCIDAGHTFNQRLLQYKHVSWMPSASVRHGLEHEDGGVGVGGCSGGLGAVGGRKGGIWGCEGDKGGSDGLLSQHPSQSQSRARSCEHLNPKVSTLLVQILPMCD